MALLDAFRGIKNSELEQVVNGLQPTNDLCINYIDASTENAYPSLYIIPTETERGAFLGHFIVEGKPVTAQIGFSRKKSFFSTEYYHVEGGKLVTSQQKNDTLYLPLAKTDYNAAENGIAFGIQGAKEQIPALLVMEKEYEYSCYGICLNESRELMLYEEEYPMPQRDVLARAVAEARGVKYALFAAEGEASNQARASSNMEEAGHGALILHRSIDDIFDWAHPPSIVRYLDKYVIGQQQAKVTLAVAFSTYMLRYARKDPSIPKSNVLLVGPSGVGKTYIVSLLAKKAGIPVVERKVTGKSSEGYRGRNLSEALDSLAEKTSDSTPYGVIFFDEIDKLAGADNFFGARLQDELIGWLEDTNIGSMETNRGQKANVSTKNVLFVTAGAFRGGSGAPALEEIITQRKRRGNAIGFLAEHQTRSGQSLHEVTAEDIIAYGLKPELVGRLPSLAVLHALRKEQIAEIITKAENSAFKDYIRILQAKGYSVTYDHSVAMALAKRCTEETGARALTSICARFFEPLLFNPAEYTRSQNIHLSGELVERILKPLNS